MKRHYCIFLNYSIPSFVHAYTFPYHVSLFIGLRGGMRHNNAVNEHSTSSVGHMVILCCFLLIHYLLTAVIFMNFELPTWPPGWSLIPYLLHTSNILPVHGSFIWTFFLLLLYIFELLFTESSTDFPCFLFANTLFIPFNRTEANGLKLWVTFPCYGLLCICCIEACHTHAWLFINHYYSKLPQTD